VWDSITNGLLQGITNVGLDYVADELNLPPLVTELGFTAVSGILEGILDFGSGTPIANRIFNEVWQGYENATLNLFRLGLQNPNDPWQRSSYIANVLNFSEIVRQNGNGIEGLWDAIETYSSAMFRQSTVQSMIDIGGSVSAYIEQQLTDPNGFISQMINGKEIKYLRIPGEDYDPTWSPLEQEFLGLNVTPGEEDIYALNEGGLNRWGVFAADGTGNFGLYNGEMIQILQDDMEAWQRMEDGDLAFVELHDSGGNIALVVSPNEDGGYIVGEDFDDWLNNKFSTDVFDVSFDYGNFYEIEQKIIYENLSDEEKHILNSFGIGTLDELGSFFYSVDPWDELKNVAFATEFNEDIRQFMYDNPELAYDVMSMIVRHSQNTWDNNYQLHRNNWISRMFNYDGRDISTYIDDVSNYLQNNTSLTDDQISDLVTQLQTDMPRYEASAGFKPSAKLNFIDLSHDYSLPNGGKLKSSFHAGCTSMGQTEQFLERYSLWWYNN